MEAQTLMERRDARRDSLVERVRACAQMVNADRQPWVVWCDLNAEATRSRPAIDGAVQIAGADDADVKEHRLHDSLRTERFACWSVSRLSAGSG